ncbi:probable oligoribonuclease isoform X2 [Prorops nasuta]|uniref:probable oligoribonuclease isoform X2 n=1 Tax=Prorops nasuta TaxID=863751 RepID=UPI0034CE0DA1
MFNTSISLLVRRFCINNSEKIVRYFDKFGHRNNHIDTMDSSKNIVWMDMEMTGLDLEKDKIMEVACVITDEDLNPITDGLNIVISQSNGMYDQLNEWCKLNHTKSGLIFDCEKSIISLKEAENSLLNFLQTYVKSQQCPLAGNTVYMDRYFLSKNMPRVNDYLHYRIIDVSSVKELIKRWHPEVFAKMPKKTLQHRALPDIKESIAELSYYKKHVFNKICHET